MSPEDQALYGGAPGVHPPDDPHPEQKTSKAERDEQRSFANWCLLNELPFTWHATHTRSKATPGTPDFIVGVNRSTLWIEFKQPQGVLSPDQEAFKGRLERQGITYYVCYSAFEAIRVVEAHNQVTV
jgi:VRR-NUC domain